MNSKMQKIESFNDDEFDNEFLEVSKFTVTFPESRKNYIKETQKYMTNALLQKKLDLEINLAENKLTVKTNKKTRDPFIIIKGRDMLSLISRGVNLKEASKVLEDNVFCEIIKIGDLCKKEDVFINRRDRLIGPNGDTLKAIMLITKTYILVQGKTVCVIGNYKNIKEVGEIVDKCFDNIHPVYQIKRLMVKRELEKDDSIRNEDWDRYLPEVKKKMKNTRGKKRKIEGDKENEKNTEDNENNKEDNENNKEDIEVKALNQDINEKKETKKKDKESKNKRLAYEEKKKKKMEKFVAPKE